MSAPATAPRPRILLIGMMGTGKSTTGHLLSRRLGWSYLDSDEEVLRRTGRSVPQIWREDGEAAFRAQESLVLAEALSSDAPAVVAVAGGAVLDPDNRSRVAQAGLVVWLRATVATIAARVGEGKGRPLLAGDPVAALERLTPEREDVYRQLADVVIDVDHLTPVEIVDRVVAGWEAARA